MHYSSKKIGGYLLAVLMLLGVATIAGTTAQAQYPGGYGQDRRDRDDRYRRNRDDDDRYRNDRNRNNRNRDDRYRNDPYGRNGNNGYYDQYQVAREQGYRNGLSTGASDAQRGQSYNPQRSHFWKNGNDGYANGNRGQYKQVFRDAFAQGYREGYQRYGGYNNNRRGNNGRWGNGRWPW